MNILSFKIDGVYSRRSFPLSTWIMQWRGTFGCQVERQAHSYIRVPWRKMSDKPAFEDSTSTSPPPPAGIHRRPRKVWAQHLWLALPLWRMHSNDERKQQFKHHSEAKLSQEASFDWILIWLKQRSAFDLIVFAFILSHRSCLSCSFWFSDRIRWLFIGW